MSSIADVLEPAMGHVSRSCDVETQLPCQTETAPDRWHNTSWSVVAACTRQGIRHNSLRWSKRPGMLACYASVYRSCRGCLPSPRTAEATSIISTDLRQRATRVNLLVVCLLEGQQAVGPKHALPYSGARVVGNILRHSQRAKVRASGRSWNHAPQLHSRQQRKRG